ncbi:MAG: serine hydrolase, partial [Thermoleophilia bacterium]
GWGWASGGLVSTPSDVSRFVRRYVPTVASVAFVPGSSSPRGPGVNAAGPGVFRYTTPCGVVYGHTGSILGYTQFMAATRDGRRSAVVSMSTQVTPDLLPPLRRTFAAAVCAALAPA